MWNIEKTVSKGDYNYVFIPNHPSASIRGYVLEHRVVMENYLGRLLDANEVVHHINGNKKDNRIENLELTTNSEHVRQHRHEQGKMMVILCCPNCKTVFHKEKNKSFLQKGNEYTCCSPKCRGQFSRSIQLHGRTTEVENAILRNFISEYRQYT